MVYEVEEYVKSLKFKYPYWNRTMGADHFFVTCHDIGEKLDLSGFVHLVMTMTIFHIRMLPSHKCNYHFFHPAGGGSDIKNRNTLACWAGRSDSKLKDELAAVLDNDTELDIQNNEVDLRATGAFVYMEKLYKSKFCFCSHGPVGSSRIADSIHYGCVPGSTKSGSVGMVYDNEKDCLLHNDSESSGSIALYWFVSAYKCQEKYNICYAEYGPNPTTTHLKTQFNNMDSTSHNLKDDYGI